ncbi:MAG TPA: hybrid sensor histidine kinase/response regulator [Cyanobacteria bacterium UBA11149]|nr:hybrid sensor histidine kinase/response regulator [Cyanobacteria bacterium UBA11366]HBK66723.1 hybrid sensor histidine kinase/response regulator [Cyanobacteria bacterium UBA11166]HBR76268.1 hybrid sensor histidine kinase/response regulator [Cyanobacteria bacterium UBA11159]HBS70555.1 hybrid sensor histidine kinase/response regulator [Cyanobacteria bacterium UBA11153]HBW90218.1 hybrid sensor histidine kinase/response regulator [Cyanobacteria bacterium UBA11149]
MTTPSLQECVEPVPVCTITTTLAVVVEIFHGSGCDAIAILDEEQQPVGVVNLRRLVPYLISISQSGVSKLDFSNGGISQPAIAIGSDPFSQPLCQLDPPLIEPLIILPASLTLNQLFNRWDGVWADASLRGRGIENREWKSRYNGEPNCDRELVKSFPGKKFSTPIPQSLLPNPYSPLTSAWGLVEEDGRFLGLLNNWQIFNSLVAAFSSSDTPAITNAQPPPIENQESRREEEKRKEVKPQKEGKHREKVNVSPPTTSEFLKPLVQLLEKLPLPLSLQTTTGEILGENLAWRELMETSPESNQIPYPIPSQFKDRSHCQYPTAEEALCCCVSARSHQLATSIPILNLGFSVSSINTHDIQPEISSENSHRLLSFTKIPLTPSLLTPEVNSQQSTVKNREWGTGNRKWGMGKKHKNSSPVSLHPPLTSHLSSLTSSIYLVLAQDRTEKEAVDRELVAKNADLVHLNRLKDEFLACISHELKTPITAILGLSTLLKDRALGALNERQARYANLIYQNGRQLMMVVNDILDLTRIETGQMELTLEPTHIKTVCDRAYTQALQAHKARDQKYQDFTTEIPFTLEIESGLEMIVADELRLRQMLVHLLSNALKFTEANGAIGLKVKTFAGWIAFTVWDLGIGIPAEKQHLIFQKFQQLEDTLTRSHQGTGLGLFLTQRLARLHGGDVSFISKSGEGSDFTLLLPPSPPQSENFTVFCHPQVSIRNRLVLVVETVVNYLEDLNEQLERLGYSVVIARCGMEAIEKARQLQPCVIFLNPLLPKLSGWDVLTILKSDIHTRHIPVLVTTTHAEKDRAYDCNADGFLTLPVQEPLLLQSLTRLGKHHYQHSTILTILYLSTGLQDSVPHSSNLIYELTNELRMQHSQLQYRILEADDLDQAELLAKIWHPNIILLNGLGISNPVAYLQAFSLEPTLASLPIVTIDRQVTEAANQVIGLSVYPCLAIDDSNKISALLEVIQVAAGLSCQYNILIMDIGNGKESEEIIESPLSHPLTILSPWMQALIQYLQTAGFRTLVSRCWADVYAQIQEKTVDLLLIHLTEINNPDGLNEELIRLQTLPNLPPILVRDRRLETPDLKEMNQKYTTSISVVESQLASIATEIMRGNSHSMSELLERLHQALAH